MFWGKLQYWVDYVKEVGELLNNNNNNNNNNNFCCYIGVRKMSGIWIIIIFIQ